MDQTNSPFIITDQQLVEGLRRNDQLLWRKVYHDNRSRVVHYLCGLGATEGVALEIYQDTLIFLDTKKESLVLTSKLSTYLTGVAILKLKEYWKKQSVAAERTRPDFDQQLGHRKPADEEIDEAELALLQLASEDGSRFGLDTDETDDMMQKALAQLTLKHCTDIFRMRYWEGIDEKEIAAKLGLSYGSLRNQMGDCKKKMKEILLGMGWGQ